MQELINAFERAVLRRRAMDDGPTFRLSPNEEYAAAHAALVLALNAEQFPIGTLKLLGSILGPLEDVPEGPCRSTAVVNAEVVIGQILADKAVMDSSPVQTDEEEGWTGKKKNQMKRDADG